MWIFVWILNGVQNVEQIAFELIMNRRQSPWLADTSDATERAFANSYQKAKGPAAQACTRYGTWRGDVRIFGIARSNPRARTLQCVLSWLTCCADSVTVLDPYLMRIPDPFLLPNLLHNPETHPSDTHGAAHCEKKFSRLSVCKGRYFAAGEAVYRV